MVGVDAFVTTAGDGYALVLDSPTELVAIPLDALQAERLFAVGVNFAPELEDGDGLDEATRRDALDALRSLVR